MTRGAPTMPDEEEPPNTRNLPQLIEELHSSIHTIAVPASKTSKNVLVPKATFKQLVALVDAIKVSLPPRPALDVQTLSEKLDQVLAAIQEPQNSINNPKDNSPTYASVAAPKTTKQRPAAHKGSLNATAHSTSLSSKNTASTPFSPMPPP